MGTGCSAMIRQFGRFRLDIHRRELLADGAAVPVGGRAFDVLLLLIEAGGELVTKDELLDRVWPGAVVEEHNLQFQISTLRKALGEDRDFIKTISGRGYRFVAEVMTPAVPARSTPGTAAARRPDLSPPTNLPEAMSDLVGRDAQLAALADLAAAHRLITLTGTGGVGKTRLGIELARRLSPQFSDGVRLVELGPLSDPALVAHTVATALGLSEADLASPERLAAALASKPLLLVLDNCEHVIDAATRIAEALLRASSLSRVIATSREPLRVEGECVYRVPLLDVPADAAQDTEAILGCGAVALFISCTRAAAPGFALDAPTVAAAASICRHLDGNPLAIMLAAARVAELGVDGIAARLNDRFDLLRIGCRTAPPRHQTLRAALDWSHELLTRRERIVMRRLAIFTAGFTLRAAGAVVGADDEGEFAGQVPELVARSLLEVDGSGGEPRYRLLETTRAYALEKLGESGELEMVARRHAEYFRDLLQRAEPEQGARPDAEWLEAHRREINDVRAALDWACSPGGDAAIGGALTAAAERLWLGRSPVHECRRPVERALTSPGPGVGGDTRRETRLRVILGAVA